jgi:hypothetical protein
MSRIPMASVFLRKSQYTATSFITDLFLPNADIQYRVENNGKVMPILPLEFSFN